MALTYDKVISVISQSPDTRKDFEVNNLLSWFRKKSDLFRNLKTELLFDIIKHLQLETKKRDDIVIRQGEKGDCMYILLRGQVTIYILYAAKSENDEEKPQPPLANVKPGESVRTQLGTFVCSLGKVKMEDDDDPFALYQLSKRDINDLVEQTIRSGRKVDIRRYLEEIGAGATFGEVALFSDDCIRTASIISDDNADLIVVDRELYNRSVKSVLQKEFEDKSNFIATSPFFHNWPPKYKKQLAMALVKDTVPYENVLVRQGEPVCGIFFILSGEVKLLSDPSQHEGQYSKFGPLDEIPLPPEEEYNEVNELLKQMSVKGHRPDEPELPKYRRKSNRKNVLELCLLGMNESVGDVEVLMDMETYMQTAVCTQRTEVLLLEMRHFERLLAKRNPRTIDVMKASLELKLTSRISSHVARQVPLLRCLADRVKEYLEQREQEILARAKTKDNRQHTLGHAAGGGGGGGPGGQGAKSTRRLTDTYNAFIPSKGPLIDLFGPGTVFHRIRKRQQAKAKQNAAGRYQSGPGGPGTSGAGGTTGAGPAGGSTTQSTPSTVARANPDGSSVKSEDHVAAASNAVTGSSKATGSKELDAAMIDPVLETLERRMRDWLINDKGTRGKLQPKWQVYDLKTVVREKAFSADSRATHDRLRPPWSPQTATKRSTSQGTKKSTLATPPHERRTKSQGGDTGGSEERKLPAIESPEKDDVYNGHAFV